MSTSPPHPPPPRGVPPDMTTIRPPPPTPHVPRPAPTPSSPTTTLTIHNFRITTTKLPILNSTEIDAMTAKLGITPPEMIFGNNEVRVEYLSPAGSPPASPESTDSGSTTSTDPRVLWGISFSALDALDLVDKTGAGGILKVAYSAAWQAQREKVHGATIKEYVRPFDWSYTTSYRGTLLPHLPPATESSPPPQYPIHPHPNPLHTLPTPLLLLPDPILLFDSLVLYEDELADNGISLYSIKLRVMPHRLLLLARFFLRLDEVLFRIRDTRVYIDFAVPGAQGEGEKEEGERRPVVLREYVEKEGTWEEVLGKMAREGVRRGEVAQVLRDAGRVEGWLEERGREMERVVLG